MKRAFALVALLITLALAAPVSALLGAGDVVFDPSALVQQVLNYIQHINTAINSATQVKNQLEMLSNEARNLSTMDASTQQRTIESIYGKLSTLRQINQQIRGMTMQYGEVERKFDELYPEFAKYNGISGQQYAQYAESWQTQTHNAIADAMKAQGLVVNAADDQENLRQLMEASRNAQGALSAAQAGNQIAAMQVQQLIQTQQIMATSYRAQSSYYSEINSAETASKAEAKRFFALPKKGKSEAKGSIDHF